MDGDAPARAGMYQLWEMRAGAPVLVGTYAEKGEAQRVLRRTPGTAIAVGGRVMETRVDVGAKQKRAFAEAVAAWRPGDAVATPTPPPPLMLAPTAGADEDDAEDGEDEPTRPTASEPKHQAELVTEDLCVIHGCKDVRRPSTIGGPFALLCATHRTRADTDRRKHAITPEAAVERQQAAARGERTPLRQTYTPTTTRPAATGERCVVPGCAEEQQPADETTAPALRSACRLHRARVMAWRTKARVAGHEPTSEELHARLVTGRGEIQARIVEAKPPTPSFPPDARYEVADSDKPDAIERGVKALRIALSNFDDCGGLAAAETRLREMASLTPADRDELAELRALAARVGGRAKLEQLVAAVEATR